MSFTVLPNDASPRGFSRAKLSLVLVVVAVLTTIFLAPGSFALTVSQLLIDGPILLAWLGAAFGVGSLLASILPRSNTFDSASPALRVVTSVALGLGLLGVIVLALGCAGVLGQPVAVGLLAAANVATILKIHRRQSAIRGYFAAGASFVQLSLLLAMPIVGATLLGALVVPWILWGDEPHAYDVVSYHFQLPHEWLEAGRIGATPHNVFGFFPLNVEMHYLLAMTLRGSATGGMFLAQLMHAAMMTLTLAAIYGAVRCEKPFAGRDDNSPPLAGGAGGGGGRQTVSEMTGSSLASRPPTRDEASPIAPPPQGGRSESIAPVERTASDSNSRLRASIALVFAAAFPWLLMLGSVGYNECGVMLFTTLALAWTLRKQWLLAGLFAGLAAGCKITSVPTLLALLPLILVVESLTRKRFEWRGPLVFLVAGGLAFSPWLVRTAALSGGNPVFPVAARTVGAGHFDAGMIERFEVAHAARPDQQNLRGRFSALNEQVLREFKFGSLSLGGIGVPALLILIVPALAIARKKRAVWILAAFIVGNVIIWLFATHLQGRFLVPIIPAAALIVGEVSLRAWPSIVLIVSALSAPFSFASVYGRLAAPPAQSGIGFGEPSVFLPEPLVQLLKTTNRPVHLVGDARAFLYPAPADRLHYRTVFDVPSDRPFKEAWLGEAPASEAIVVVAPSELARFEKTYRNLPMMPDDWRGRPMFVTDVEFKSFLPLE